MLFKKEFDIDKEFFMEKPHSPSKRKIAMRVFIPVLFFTFGVLCYSAFTYSSGTKFGVVGQNINRESLKEAQEYFFEAVKLYEDGNFDSAIEKLNRQLKIVDDPDAYNYLAKIYLEKGDVELAIENFKKAIEFNPDFFEPNFELGKIYFSMNDYKNASKYLTTAAGAQTENAEVLSLTADAYKLTGHGDDAIVLLEKVLLMNPNSAPANAKIGEIYFQKLKYEDAIPYLDEALKLNFEENVAMQLSKCYLELGNYGAAMNVVNEVLSENKENKQAQSLKRAIEYKQGEAKISAPIKQEKRTPVRQEIPVNKELLNKYIKDIETPIKTNWTPPAGSNLKKASVKFMVNKKGELVSNKIYVSSGSYEFDRSALDAIEMSKPYPALPAGLGRDSLDIIFTFDFNIGK